MDAITGAVTLVAGSGTTITDNSPSAGDITIAVSGTASGAEIAYSPVTATVNVASTTEATPTTVISPGAITFNGSPVIVEFFTPAAITPTAGARSVVVGLYEGGTEITRLGIVAGLTIQIETALYCRYRFTPSAAAHTYTIGAWANSTTGTPQIVAGAGGAVAYPPAFVRFSYA